MKPNVVTHENYFAAITRALCVVPGDRRDAEPKVHLVFGAGPRQRGLSTLHRVWGGGKAADPLPLVEIAAIGGLSPAETCHVLLHELAHVLAPEGGHGAAWRHAARQVGLVQPRAAPDVGELADWNAISPALHPALQAIPPPTERAPAEFFERIGTACRVPRATARAATPAADITGALYTDRVPEMQASLVYPRDVSADYMDGGRGVGLDLGAMFSPAVLSDLTVGVAVPEHLQHLRVGARRGWPSRRVGVEAQETGEDQFGDVLQVTGDLELHPLAADARR